MTDLIAASAALVFAHVCKSGGQTALCVERSNGSVLFAEVRVSGLPPLPAWPSNGTGEPPARVTR